MNRSVIVISLLTRCAPALSPHHREPVGVGDALLDQRVDAGQDIEVRMVEEAADHVAIERVAVADAPAVVRPQHGEPARGQHLHVIQLQAPEAEPVGVPGPAVNLDTSG